MKWERHPPRRQLWTWRNYFVLRGQRFEAYEDGEYSNDPAKLIDTARTLAAAKKLCEQHREGHS